MLNVRFASLPPLPTGCHPRCLLCFAKRKMEVLCTDQKCGCQIFNGVAEGLKIAADMYCSCNQVESKQYNPILLFTCITVQVSKQKIESIQLDELLKHA